MRQLVGGLVLLLIFASTALAQPKGAVESIGFNFHYRPDAWTPMRVRVSAEESGTYQLQVIQQDLDAEEPIYTRDVTITGTDEGAGEQRFWLYFLPQPTDGGLYDRTRGGSASDLQRQLRVYLADEDGEQISQLPINDTVLNLEPTTGIAGMPGGASARGTKLILAITEGASQPVWKEYEQSLGILEDVVFVTLAPRDLPDLARGYEGVDAIVWFDAAPPSGTTEEARLSAIRQYLKLGGELIIMQPPERDATRAWGEMLPVRVNEIAELPAAEPLASWAQRVPDAEVQRAWNIPGPFRAAQATPKAGTRVEYWLDWPDGTRTPLVVRQPYGLGSITWVAQNLGDPNLTARANKGWPHIWDRVFDWPNATVVRRNDMSLNDERLAPYIPATPMDVGVNSAGSAIELGSKSRAFVGLAVVFFVIYWLVAGPGIYLYLAAKARSAWSWFSFAAAGIAATLLTVAVVQLLVRGDPELQHVTLIRKAQGEPAVALSRFGLYIPRSGFQELELTEVEPGGDSYIGPYAPHPEHLGGISEFAAGIDYVVPVHDVATGEPVAVQVPYRSTLKKLEAQWVGPMDKVVEGKPVLSTTAGNFISGPLTNATGQTLHNVFIAFNNPRNNTDQVLYMPQWNDGITLDLAKEFDYRTSKFAAPPGDPATATQDVPDRGKQVQGTITVQWARNWYAPLRSDTGFGPTNHIDSDREGYKRSIPMLSFFDRLPPVRSDDQKTNRFELLRRNARHFDVSAALSAGQLVVLAEAPGPLPIPLSVEGDRVGGEGVTYYQFVLPLQNNLGTNEPAPTTAPVEPGQQQQQQEQEQQASGATAGTED